MALRAGYYGLKKVTKDKLLNLANAAPSDIGPENPIASKNDVLASIDLFDDTVGWIGGNEYDFTKNEKDGVNTAIALTTTGVRVYTTANTTYAVSDVLLSELNLVNGKKYVLVADVTYVSGTGKMALRAGYTIKVASPNITASGKYVLPFEMSADFTRVSLFATFAAAEAGDVTYDNVMILTEEQYALNPSYRPYHESVEEYAFPRAEQAVLGAVNELNNTATSDTIQGLVTTVNADKSVSIAAGTVTGGNYVYTLTVDAGIPAGKRVFLSGCPKGGSTNTYMLAYQNASDQWVNAQYDVGNGSWIEDGIKRVAISIINGVTVSAMTFKPMISLSDKTPYAPFTMTNRELTEKAIIYRSGLTSSDDLNNVVTTGIYYATTSPVNTPESKSYFPLIVIKRTDNDLVQFIPYGAILYIRHKSSLWEPWYKYTGTEVTPPSPTPENETKKATKKKIIKEEE